MIFTALDMDGRETLTRRDVDQLRLPGEADAAIVNFFATVRCAPLCVRVC